MRFRGPYGKPVWNIEWTVSILINPDSDSRGKPDTQWRVKPDTCSSNRTSNCIRAYPTRKPAYAPKQTWISKSGRGAKLFLPLWSSLRNVRCGEVVLDCFEAPQLCTEGPAGPLGGKVTTKSSTRAADCSLTGITANNALRRSMASLFVMPMEGGDCNI